MATTTESNFRTFVAGADLSSSQFCGVKLSSGNVIVCTAQTDKCIGILDNAPVSGDDAVVRLLSSAGTGKVKTAGSGSAGDKLTTTTAGAAIATVTSTHRVFGLALTDFTSGDVVEYLPVTEVVA